MTMKVKDMAGKLEGVELENVITDPLINDFMIDSIL